MAVDPGTANRAEKCHCFKNHPHFIISFNALPFYIVSLERMGVAQFWKMKSVSVVKQSGEH